MDGHTDVVDLREYARLLLRRRWTVLLVALGVVVAAMALTLSQTPVYRATTDLAIEPVRQSSDTSLEEFLFPNTLVETERRVVASLPVAQRVAEDLGGDADPRDLLEQLTVATVRDTRVLQVSVDDEDAERAAAVSRGFAQAYLDHRRQSAVDEIIAATAELDSRAEQLRSEIAALNAAISQTVDPVEAEALRVQRDGLNGTLAAVLGRVAESSGGGTVVRGGGTILTPAEVPARPASPKPLRTGVLAVVLGLMLGVGAALLRDYLDDAIRSDEDLKRASNGLSVLGRIPHWDDAGDTRRAATLVAPRSVVAEAYRALRTNLRFLLSASSHDRGRSRAGGADLLGGPGQTLLVTSATSGDGKTSTATNLAISFARAGRRVVLVDADMRKPRVAEVFGAPGGAGLSDAIAGLANTETVLRDVGVDNLRVVTSGPIPPNPAELLGSPGMRGVQYDLERLFEIVVIDSPPVLSVADALEIGPYTHGVVLVAAAGRASRRAVRHAVDALAGIGAHVLGAVLNDIEEGDAYYGYQYYYKDYVEDADDTPASSQKQRRGIVRTRGGESVPPADGAQADSDDGRGALFRQ